MHILNKLKKQRVEGGYTVAVAENTADFEEAVKQLSVHPTKVVVKISAGGERLNTRETDRDMVFCVANTYKFARQLYIPHCLARKLDFGMSESPPDYQYQPLEASVSIDFDHPQAPFGQEEFTESLLKTVETKGCALAIAETSAGKTVTGVYAICKLGLRALVVVDKVQIAKQWVSEFEKFTDLRESNGDIFVVSSKARKKWAFGDKKPSVTIIVLHSLKNKVSSGELDVFAYGTVLVDELDTAATELSIKAIYALVAKYYIGMTATPTRKDGSHESYMKLFDGCEVRSTAKSLNLTFFDLHLQNIPHEHEILVQSALLHLNSGQDGTGVTEKKDPFTRVVGRTERLCAFIANLVLRQGRQVLAFARFVGMCNRVASILEQRYNLKVLDFSGDTKKDLTDYNLLEYNVIVGTPSKFKRGVNVPSLDTIVEVTPIGFHEQYYGRIRRLYPNKKNPLHVSIRDVDIECLESLQNAKVAQTKKCAYAEIISGRLGDIAQ